MLLGHDTTHGYQGTWHRWGGTNESKNHKGAVYPLFNVFQVFSDIRVATDVGMALTPLWEAPFH